MDAKVTGLKYCYAKALDIIKEQFPAATEDCFAGDYETAYWNNEEAYVNRQGSWEYPGKWHPSPIAYTDEQMINYLVKTGSSNLANKQNTD